MPIKSEFLPSVEIFPSAGREDRSFRVTICDNHAKTASDAESHWARMRGRSMARSPDWTYLFRIPGRNPAQLRMDRLAEYMQEFAELLGVENNPIFAGIKNASIGIRARVPATRKLDAWKRVQTAKSYPDSAPARNLRRIEVLLSQDSLRSAELRDTANNVIYLFKAPEVPAMSEISIRQRGEIDGVVTGLVGGDDTMHLHLRDAFERNLKFLLRDEGIARDLLAHFRAGVVRLHVHGIWTRTDSGWAPENNRCTITSFDVLDETPAADVLAALAAAVAPGWQENQDPTAEWLALRGVN